ncbi:unnamed protein product [Ranitomeya imitator]|uniref:Uncharacterized protein n=1 Tax=Ranitomeya imitator TaxID=111125 RepID=A0ABN9M2W5_9NEOB|nr:unnamed protein product [Ranitomeya imitator]
MEIAAHTHAPCAQQQADCRVTRMSWRGRSASCSCAADSKTTEGPAATSPHREEAGESSAEETRV